MLVRVVMIALLFISVRIYFWSWGQSWSCLMTCQSEWLLSLSANWEVEGAGEERDFLEGLARLAIVWELALAMRLYFDSWLGEA